MSIPLSKEIKNRNLRNVSAETLIKLMFFIALISAFVFVSIGVKGIGIGFPLDDAWIHQTYARNLATGGSWSFVPGIVSGGSTSPLWTILLSFGFFFKGNFYFYWTLILSAGSFCLLVFFSVKAIRNLGKTINRGSLIVFGFVIALEWHLLWTTVSGMETILFSLVIVLLFYFSTGEQTKWWLPGLFSGILIWIRPDGITILGPMLIALLNEIFEKKRSKRIIVEFMIPIALIYGMYTIFNFSTTGQYLPNTFYAKQMEYQKLLESPLLQRILLEIQPILVGAGALLAPGFIFEMFHNLKTRNVKLLGFIIWVVGFVVMYAIRLPVVYQHGRYVIPTIPIFMIFGFLGTINLFERIKKTKIQRLSILGWYGAILATSVIFFFLGINAYRSDRNIIDTLMVQPAEWVAENTNSDDTIIVHDIGAMGFFSKRHIIDLAGLINPEVIPFIRDEAKIGEYISGTKSQYFIGFDDWYENSAKWGRIVKTFSVETQDETKNVIVIKLNN